MCVRGAELILEEATNALSHKKVVQRLKTFPRRSHQNYFQTNSFAIVLAKTKIQQIASSRFVPYYLLPTLR